MNRRSNPVSGNVAIATIATTGPELGRSAAVTGGRVGLVIFVGLRLHGARRGRLRRGLWDLSRTGRSATRGARYGTGLGGHHVWLIFV